MQLEINLKYSSEQEAEEALEQYRLDKAGRRILSQLRDELRSVCKYGNPTERDEFWYARLFELCGEQDIDGWEV